MSVKWTEVPFETNGEIGVNIKFQLQEYGFIKGDRGGK